jgi:hypothetical protein
MVPSLLTRIMNTEASLSTSFFSAAQQRVKASYGEALSNFLASPAKQALLAGAIGVAAYSSHLMNSVSAFAIQATGFVGLLIGQLAPQNKNHRHILAINSLSTAFLTAQCVALGDYAGAAMMGHAALFLATCAALPEDTPENPLEKKYKNVKLAATAGLTATGVYLAGKYAYQDGGHLLENFSPAAQFFVNHITEGTVLANAFAFVQPDHKTQRARIMYPLLNTLHGLYFLTRANPSPILVAIEGALLISNTIGLYRFDLPAADFNGRPLKLSEKAKIYFRDTIWHGDDRSAHALTRDDLKEREKAFEARPTGSEFRPHLTAPAESFLPKLPTALTAQPA